MSPEELAALDRRHLWHPFTQHQEWNAAHPLIIGGAEGCFLVDVDGRRYLDGVSSLWTNVHGHRHPRIDAAVRAQLDRVAHTTLLGLTHPGAIRLAAELARRSPPGLERVFLSDNGSTATEVALKMAFQLHQQRGSPGRTRFAGLADAYHGDTLGAVSVGDIPLFHQVYRPLLFDALALPAPFAAGGEEEATCLAQALALLDAHGHELAALIVEPFVQAAAGMKMHSAAYLGPLLERARALGVLLVVDEVAVGFGRLGTLFASEQLPLVPDFLCLAKGLGAGYLPIAATVTTDEVYAAFLAEPSAGRHFFHGHTFTGNPLACAAALASLELFDESPVLDHVAALAAALAERLAVLARHPLVGEVRHRGVMAGVDLVRADGSPWPPEARAGHRVCAAARPLGAILRPLGDTLVFNPPLAMPVEQLHTLLEIAERAIDEALSAA